MKRVVLLAGLGLAACFATAAPAAEGARTSPGTEMRHHSAPKTRAEVEARVKARFAALDLNNDGFLTPDELHRRAGEERADRLFAMMDKDGNGQISKAEFEAFHADHPRGPRFAHGHDLRRAGMRMMHMHRQMLARRMFEREDADHDGKISLAEAEKAALDRFDGIDSNHDGVISEAEHQAARAQMAMRWRERRGHRWGHNGWDHREGMPLAPNPAPQG
jgi:Ca2+-binding EF-hand superfamily protein